MKKIFWELILLVASVLVFRALWLWLDSVEWMSGAPGITASLIVGIALSFLALLMIHRK